MNEPIPPAELWAVWESITHDPESSDPPHEPIYRWVPLTGAGIQCWTNEGEAREAAEYWAEVRGGKAIAVRLMP